MEDSGTGKGYGGKDGGDEGGGSGDGPLDGSSEALCFECGSPGAVYEGLCRECYLRGHLFLSVPDYVDIYVCPHCGALKRGERWVDMEDVGEAVERAVRDAVEFTHDVVSVDLRVDIFEETPSVFRVHVRGVLYGRPPSCSSEGSEPLMVEREADTTVRISNLVCDVCSRKHGNYYESVVQLRGFDRKLSEEEKEEACAEVMDLVDAMARDNRQVFLSRVEEMHGGLDFYVSTTDAGRKIARHLARERGASVKESAKLAGRKDGRDYYRTTFSVRLPPFGKGDFVVLDRVVYRVEIVSRSRVDMRDLATGEVVRMRRDFDSRVRVLGGDEIVEEGVVVFETEDEVQVLDPVTYRTVTLKKPAHFRRGEVVKIVRYEDQIFIV